MRLSGQQWKCRINSDTDIHEKPYENALVIELSLRQILLRATDSFRRAL